MSYCDGLRAAALALFSMISAASFGADYAPRTGDRDVDQQLTEINELALGVREAAIDEVVGTYGAPRYLVHELLEQRQWAAGDVFFACAVAYRVRRTCAEVARDYEQQPEPGLGTLARSRGMRPGSASFQTLKAQLAKSRERLAALAPTPEASADGPGTAAEEPAK